MDCTDLLCASVVVSGGTSPYSRMKSRRRPSMRAIGCSASLRHQTACRITYMPLPLLRPVLALRACDVTYAAEGLDLTLDGEAKRVQKPTGRPICTCET